jgi:hypothetical protein
LGGANKALSILFFGKHDIYIDIVVIVIGGLCVPWMLFAKPLILKSRHDKGESHDNHRGSDEIELVNLNNKKERE